MLSISCLRDVQKGSGVYNDPSRHRHSQTLPHTDVIGSAPRGSGSDLGLIQSYHTRQADQGGAVHCAGPDWSSTGNTRLMKEYNKPDQLTKPGKQASL